MLMNRFLYFLHIVIICLKIWLLSGKMNDYKLTEIVAWQAINLFLMTIFNAKFMVQFCHVLTAALRGLHPLLSV